MKKKLRSAALIGFLGIFLASGGMLTRDVVRSGREREANQKLARQVQEAANQQFEGDPVPKDPKEEEEAIPERTEDEDLHILPQYQALWQQNQDMAGWISIEGIEVDYPVMYTKEDEEYYLHRGFDGSYAVSGCLFIGKGWEPEASYTIIYGHHMKDGSMFGRLEKYQSKEYAKQYPTICFDTLTEEREYQVIAAFYSRVYNQNEEGVFRYYQYTDLSEEEIFYDYINRVKESSLYDLGVEAEYGDRILTLSTCSYYTDHGRFVVVARQKKEEKESTFKEKRGVYAVG